MIVVRCLMTVVCSMSFVVGCAVCAVSCVMLLLRCLLFLVCVALCCVLCVVSCVAYGSLFEVRWLSLVVC